MMQISLGHGRFALVDDEDYDIVSGYSWCAAARGHTFYAQRTVPSSLTKSRETTIMMHVLLTGWKEVDHVDHNGLNNQRSNLRQATRAQNTQNRRKLMIASSQYKGVTFHKQRFRWQARIKQKSLGMFDSEEDAARAYDAAARELYGDFACLNFPDNR